MEIGLRRRAGDGPPPAVRGVQSMRQDWRDLAFLHWPITSELVEPLQPSRVSPDVLDGTTYVGIIGLRIASIAAAGAVPVPWLGIFDEIHLRLYSVDWSGRRGAVFLALNADRLLTSAFTRIVLRVPYAVGDTRDAPGQRHDVHDPPPLAPRTHDASLRGTDR
jgi:uncharacterized protein